MVLLSHLHSILRRRSRAALLTLIVLPMLMAASCDVEPRPFQEPSRAVVGGQAERGRDLLYAYGCTSCHVVPGVTALQGRTGPPLDEWSRRRFIAGEIANDAANLVQWIQAPQSIRPGTAMPNLGVGEQDARDIAAYLLRLQ